jgi:hypothetical protein
MSKIITVIEGNLPSGVKINEVKTKDQKDEFAKDQNKTITLTRFNLNGYPNKPLDVGDKINLRDPRSLFLKFDNDNVGAFFSNDKMTKLGKIQSITIIPIEPRQVAIQIGNAFYIFNYDDIFVNTNMVENNSSSSSSSPYSSAKASLGDNVPINHYSEISMPGNTDLTKLANLSTYKGRLYIEEVPKTGNFINIPNNIDEVANLYLDSLGVGATDIYQFDISKINTVLVIDDNEDINFPIYVLILIDRTYYKFPYNKIKIQVLGKKSVLTTSSSSSSASSASSSLASSAKASSSKASSSKASSSAKASSSSSSLPPNSPSSFFINNGVDQSNTKGYIGINIQSDFCEQVMNFIQANNLIKFSNFPPRNINDIPEFYVFIDSINSQNKCNLIQINLKSIERREIISGSNRFKSDIVVFTYKLSDFKFFNNDNELYVPIQELYYREPTAPIPRGEKEHAAKSRSVRFDPSPSFASSKSVPTPSKEVLPLTREDPKNHSSYEGVEFDSIPNLDDLQLPFDTTKQNLYLYYGDKLHEIPNISSVEEGSNNNFITVTQIMPKGSPVQLEYQQNLLYQAPKNDDTLLRANLQKKYNDLKDSETREKAAGLQQPTPSQIQLDKFNAIMSDESLGDLAERYEVYQKNSLKEQLQKKYNDLKDSETREKAAGLQQPTPSQIQLDKFNSIMGDQSIGDLAERYNVYLKSVSEPPKSDVEVNINQPVNDITNYNSNTFNKRFYNLYAREREGDTYKIYQLKNIVDVIPQKDNSVRVTLRKNDGSMFIKNFYNKGQLTQAPKTNAEIDEEIVKEYNELKSAAEAERVASASGIPAAASGIKSGISLFGVAKPTSKIDDFEKFKTTMGLTSGLPPSLVAAASPPSPVASPSSSAIPVGASSSSSSSVAAPVASVAPSASVAPPSSAVPVAAVVASPLVSKYKALYHYKPPPPGPTSIKPSTAPAPAPASAPPSAPPSGPPPPPGSSNKSTAKGLKPGSSSSSSSQSASSSSQPSSSNTAATVVNQTSNIKPPEIVPNELFIVLNTSIPGSQKIFYSPKMTIKDSNAKSIRFNPLVELEPSVINKTPKDLRIKQFFDKGLFESLINFHGLEKVRTLVEAMNDGIINNNILVTLNTIFAINTPIYINGEVYYIADVQWTQGDWAIDTKEKPVSFDVSKIKNPYIYSAIVNDDIISGQSQLKSLSPNVLTGANYKGLPPQMNATPSSLSTISPLSTLIGVPVAQGLQQQPQLIPIPPASSTAAAPPAAPPQNINVQVTSPALEAAAAALAAQAAAQAKAAQPLAITAGPPPAAKSLAIGGPGTSTTGLPGKPPLRITGGPAGKPLLALPSSSSSSVSSSVAKGGPAVVELGESELEIPPLNLKAGARQTAFLRKVFGTGQGSTGGIYYETMNYLFRGIQDNTAKNSISDLLRAIVKGMDVTTVTKERSFSSIKNVVNISKTAYEQTVADLHIHGTTRDGNCFFSAIATAINNYNYFRKTISPKENNIVYVINGAADGVIYGINREFDQETIRYIVFDFLEQNQGYLIDLLEATKGHMDILNGEFNNVLRTNFDNAGIKLPTDSDPEINDRMGEIYSDTVTQSIPQYHPGFGTNINYNITELFTPDVEQYKPFSFMEDLVEMDPKDPNRIDSINIKNLKTYVTVGTTYWGDDVSIDAVNFILNLNIIAVKKGNEIPKGSVIPNPGLPNSINEVYGIFQNNNRKYGIDINRWTHFLFIFLENNHYDLFTFDYQVGGNKLPFTIFKKDDVTFPPALYMLLLIFGFQYMNAAVVDADFVFYPNLYRVLNESYIAITDKNTLTINDKCTMLNNFYDLFRLPRFQRAINDSHCNRINRGRTLPKSSISASSDVATGYETAGGAGNRRTRRNYNYNYNNNNNYNNNYPNNFLKRDAVRDVSKIGYYISIDLELKKGSPLTPEEIGESKCTRKWNTVRKAFANFTGKTYTIPPVYDYSNKQTLKNKPNNKPNNVTRSNKPPPPAPQTQTQTPQTQAPPTQTQAPPAPPPKTGGTRKNEVKHIYLNGKHNKTIKKL